MKVEMNLEEFLEKIASIRAKVLEQEADLVKAREVLENFAHHCWEGTLDSETFQEEMLQAGLFVLVEADEEHRAEYGAETMFTWSWSELAAAERAKG